MLPHVDPQQRLLARRHDVLVLGHHDLQVPALGVLHQPAPAAALQRQEHGVELLLELLERAPARRERGHELGRDIGLRGGRGRRHQVLPEERVVDVPAGGEVDGALQVDLAHDVALIGGRGLRCECVVQVVDVRLVVLGVVQRHDLSADRGLQCLPDHKYCTVLAHIRGQQLTSYPYGNGGRVYFPAMMKKRPVSIEIQ